MGINLKIGELMKGKRNLITDVPGVMVGHADIRRGRAQTGVTVLIPGDGNLFARKIPAGVTVLNGFGKSVGLVEVEEMGRIETPVGLTNTFSVGTVWQALVKSALRDNPEIGRKLPTVNPVVFECNDGYLNDIRGFFVTEAMTFKAMKAAGSLFEEGACGAGRGMKCFGLKGGIGSASRIMAYGNKEYVLGALVLTNHGRMKDLLIDGEKVGRRLTGEDAKDMGSVIVIIGTDMPLSSRQLKRISKRALVGLARTGSYLMNGSGEISLAFSTASRIAQPGREKVRTYKAIPDKDLDLPFRAVAETVEEAVLSSLYHAESVTGRDKHRLKSLKEVLNDL